METRLCRICGKFADEHLNIFKTEGLKNKLETCLPIIVSKHCLLPDTICLECTENVENFYAFMKNVLQNLIILEAQFDIHESGLKSKRKFEKGTSTEVKVLRKEESTQTNEISYFNVYRESVDLSKTLEEAERTLSDKSYLNYVPKTDCDKEVMLVDYELSDNSSDGDCEDDSNRKEFVESFMLNRKYFDNQENKLINRIAQRIGSKRKNEEILPYKAKICKFDVNNRRKSRQPKKIELRSIENVNSFGEWNKGGSEVKNAETNEGTQQVNGTQISLPQLCLLCDSQFGSAPLLAAHVFEMHGIDMAQVISSEPILEKKKKIPNLVKITDLKIKNEQELPVYLPEDPPTLQPIFVCPLCPAELTIRNDLYTHLRIKHPKQSSLMCGLCMHMATSFASLVDHLETCKDQHQILNKYVCNVCCYNEDNSKLIENHVIVHDFLMIYCKRQSKIFDPSDYVRVNADSEVPAKTYTCTECDEAQFEDFKVFSSHRRSQHQIFHCDLCNKFYGRNSHLWKHVNRLHKGHPSITCQLCYKTSASKYHLAQHFSKIHRAKLFDSKQDNSQEQDNFMRQKFQGFDFQSVKQSFMRQELLKTEVKESVSEASDDEIPNDSVELPKEIDSTSNLYTNIITNYTPPQNNGEFKCPKCLKGFHKRNLLKKHKKNCRPRLQKDLLTRCKTCSRIFKDRQSLTKHLINYHSEYVCEICGQKFQSKCEIVSHIRFTHPNCHLFCTCGNILRKKEDLMAHKQDHRNSFVCQFCADALPTKIKLKMHILSLHRKILSLSCGICLRLFETQHILRDHVRLVHKEHLLPLTSCTVCGKNYGSKWKTFDHLNKSHGRIFKPCKACLEVFDSEEQLQSHYEVSHTKFTKSKPMAPQQLKKEYESDCFDNDEKQCENTNSEISNEGFEPEDVQTKFNLSTNESKISLLEKRLLGKKPDEKKPSVNNSPLQNSSKRTVYVNSYDPSLCEICLKTWPAKKHLWQHYIRCHKMVAATVCGICLKVNETYVSLQQHLKVNHPTLLHGQGFGSNFICKICGRYHNASSKLKLHMAIHENFDWKILEEIKTEPVDNGFNETDITPEIEINYESLIEQVECTSESESDDKSQYNQDEESSSSEASDNKSEASDSLESQMLKNMLIEKDMLAKGIVDNDVKQELTSSDSEDSSSSSYTQNDYEVLVKIESSEDENDDDDSLLSEREDASNDCTRNLFDRQPEELDSAIKSISFERENAENQFADDQFVDIQAHNPNPNEIQSAVDSIL